MGIHESVPVIKNRRNYGDSLVNKRHRCEQRNTLAFPLGELQAAIKDTNDYNSREIERLPQQSQAQIEHLLCRSIKQNKILEIQLNSLDEYERVKPSIRGVFRGMAEFDVVLIGDQQIDFYAIIIAATAK